ncbi:MAG TPA: FtsX-like permease family protein [Blastocatellia bacterium]|nr:FtsX-like permease family protein [Blastocatellia bacterium]
MIRRICPSTSNVFGTLAGRPDKEPDSNNDSWSRRISDGNSQRLGGIVLALASANKAPARGSDDFQVQNQKSLVDTQIESSKRLGFFVRWIGITGLVVSGIGILAIYWIAVKERTVEFGTRRALGATAPAIFFQILLESIVVSSTGSIAGVGAGWECSKTVARFAGLPFVFDGSNAVLALAVSLSLNLFFSCLPAAKASSLEPVQALKYE